jgi:hypothetical protein
MNKAEEYFYSDFTQGSYAELIDLAKSSYPFIGYQEIGDRSRYILWRHDVDFSMHVAAELAEIEHHKQVKATYFIYPHSEFYNLFEKEIFLLVKRIQELGHHIGLHFDSHFYNIQNVNQLEAALIREKELLDRFFQTEIRVFSFHNNNDFTMGCEEWMYAGLINTYASVFKTHIGYCSDSHSIWRFRRLKDVLTSASDDRLQVLTHPEWWQKLPMPPRRKMLKCVYGRAESNIRYYDSLLKKMNRPNIDE